MRFGKLSGRVFLIVFATMLASLAISGSVSFFTLLEAQRRSGRDALEDTLYQVRLDLERDYQSLLMLSQNMTASGPIGGIVQEYLHARDMYEKGATQRKLTKTMSTYSGLASELVMYFDIRENEPSFFNFLPDAEFMPAALSASIYSNDALTYYAIRPSFSRYSNRPVLALSRGVAFDDDTIYMIYIEQQTNVPAVMESARGARETPHIFLQLDMEGRVQYTSDSKRFPPNKTIALPGGAFGRYQEYFFARTNLSFGSPCVLLSPISAYNQSVNVWLRRSTLASVIIAGIVFLGARLLYRYVFAGLRVFSNEIDKTIAGGMEPSAWRTGISELDALLVHFDHMKARIKGIMREEAEREERRRDQERERLIYQINPHFLLNTLHSVHWLAVMNKQHEISRYISNLSAILSYSLGRTSDAPTLRSELSMLSLYLDIEQCRHDFCVKLDIEEGAYLDRETPRLILQPIVENAIGHGMDEGGTLRICVGWDPVLDIAEIHIEDDGVGIPEETLSQLRDADVPGAGVGLRYVRAMLGGCAPGASIRIDSESGRGTRVTLRLPFDRRRTI
ncbi:MAG: histidine kinase [Oscillospiraceae bacterium]|jgi:two-component system sensor histidine kinase YesM|nr:histidine kinase [Oscillospiraceae bacterium]